jgi:hypothetical protein
VGVLIITCLTLVYKVRNSRMCLNETYSRVQVDKHLFDVFPTRNGFEQGEALSPLLFSFALEYAIRRMHVNQDLEIKWYTFGLC